MGAELELIDEEGNLGLLVGLREDGTWEAANAAYPLAGGISTRYVSELWVRLRVWGQQAAVCGVSALNAHEESEDVWVVGKTINVRRRRWYKVMNNPPYTSTTLYTSTWTEEKTASPGGFHLLLAAAGDPPPEPVSCTVNTDGEKPSDWDGPTDDPGPDYSYASEELAQTADDRQDLDIITGSSLASAAQGGEVLLYDGGWQLSRRYARQWFDGNTLGVLSGYSAKSLAGDVRRVQVDVEMRGIKIPCRLVWSELTLHYDGSSASETVDREEWLELGHFSHSVVLSYPAYKAEVFLQNLRIVPV